MERPLLRRGTHRMTPEEIRALVQKADALIRETHDLQLQLQHAMDEQARALGPANASDYHRPARRKSPRKLRR